MSTSKLTVRPLTPDTWDDFEAVMGTNGGARGCWCMHWRLSMTEFMESKGEGNKAAMRELAEHQRPPGVVAYLKEEPVAWCAFGAHSDFPRLQRSPIAKPMDEEPVIALTCLLIKKSHREAGLSTELITAVCGYLAETSERRTVEAYPVEAVEGRRAGPDSAMTGIASAFIAAGFTEIARPRKDRAVMRYSLA